MGRMQSRDPGEELSSCNDPTKYQIRCITHSLLANPSGETMQTASHANPTRLFNPADILPAPLLCYSTLYRPSQSTSQSSAFFF